MLYLNMYTIYLLQNDCNLHVLFFFNSEKLFKNKKNTNILCIPESIFRLNDITFFIAVTFRFLNHILKFVVNVNLQLMSPSKCKLMLVNKNSS